MVSILLVVIGGIAYQLKIHPVFQCILLFYLGGITATFHDIPLLKTIYAQAQEFQASKYIPAVVIILMTALLYRFGDSHKAVTHAYILVCLPFLLHLFARQVRVPDSAAELVAIAGNITYASYLLHFPMQLTVKLAFDLGGSPVPKSEPLFFACYLIYVTLFSVLTYRSLEMPLQNWLRAMLLKPGQQEKAVK